MEYHALNSSNLSLQRSLPKRVNRILKKEKIERKTNDFKLVMSTKYQKVFTNGESDKLYVLVS
jgi:hypothetical protein